MSEWTRMLLMLVGNLISYSNCLHLLYCFLIYVHKLVSIKIWFRRAATCYCFQNEIYAVILDKLCVLEKDIRDLNGG